MAIPLVLRRWIPTLGRYVFTVFYQLVFHFPKDSLSDYDAMIALENSLIAVLGRSAHVDGHDCGSGECNIFIVTGYPAETFHQARPSLERADCLASVRVAYRDMAGEDYIVLWPEGSTEEFAVA